jgi:putative sigma-54 modulation protein
MKMTIIGRHIELDDDTKEYAEKKLSKAETFFDQIIEANMILSAEKHRRIAEVTLNAKNATFHATEETENINNSIDNVMEKVEVQVKKFKEKLKDHKRQPKGLISENQIGINEPEENDDVEELEQDKEPQIIKVNKFAPKPMTVQEAVMQLDLLEDDFLVFSNSQTNQVNVVYKRKDRAYGWIEPDF